MTIKISGKPVILMDTGKTLGTLKGLTYKNNKVTSLYCKFSNKYVDIPINDVHIGSDAIMLKGTKNINMLYTDISTKVYTTNGKEVGTVTSIETNDFFNIIGINVDNLFIKIDKILHMEDIIIVTDDETYTDQSLVSTEINNSFNTKDKQSNLINHKPSLEDNTAYIQQSNNYHTKNEVNPINNETNPVTNKTDETDDKPIIIDNKDNTIKTDIINDETDIAEEQTDSIVHEANSVEDQDNTIVDETDTVKNQDDIIIDETDTIENQADTVVDETDIIKDQDDAIVDKANNVEEQTHIIDNKKDTVNNESNLKNNKDKPTIEINPKYNYLIGKKLLKDVTINKEIYKKNTLIDAALIKYAIENNAIVNIIMNAED